ncbi:MAG: tRNA uridine-5-carboxymethylaminomethyl(34) synthesis GTPase MnmE [Parvularculaceae bacterium]|nr:tRNA uridine-5-carboxymethylaminomethyl(34) synthesis GTPase MnmE [Parvularculaceae bacterium]
MASHHSTIFARASGAGRAGVAVWRISGPEAFAVARRLCRTPPPKNRRAGVRDLLGADGALIDRGLVLLFKGPCSFTGEDVAELHVHGGRAVETALARALLAAGGEPAEAGAFTRRAFENGKLDLAQVEALADLIDAETDRQRRQALGQLDGRLSEAAQVWRARLVKILAPLEAEIDFPDEDGVPAAVAARAGPEIEALVDELARWRDQSVRTRIIRDGVRVAIIGAPNAGKSTLMNRFAGSELAIVAPTPGTTRDVIEARIDIEGIAVLIADTAGLRETTDDPIEREGIRRTRVRADDADIRILVVDAEALGEGSPTSDTIVSRETAALLRDGDLVALNKVDGPSRLSDELIGAARATLEGTGRSLAVYPISARLGFGVDVLFDGLASTLRDRVGPGDETGLTRLRHVEAVETAIAALGRAQTRLADAPELAAEDVRIAARALAAIVGAVDVEAVLGEIFSSFCIGK